MSVRRLLLDPILVQAAVEAGAEVRMGTKVTALVRDRGRVKGVHVTHNGSEQALEARLVVGAASARRFRRPRSNCSTAMATG